MPSNHLQYSLFFLEGVQIMPSNHLQCYSFLEEDRLCHQIIYNVIYFFRGSTDYAIILFRMLFIFLEGVQIMPSTLLECYLFLEGVQIMPSNHLQCYFFLEGVQIMPSNHLEYYLFF
jgi:hypothetical protein